MRAWRLIDSPIRYVRGRELDSWGAAFPVLLFLTITSATSVVVSTRVGVLRELPGLPVVLAEGIGFVTVVAAGAAMFWIQAGALVLLDAVFAQSGQTRRLVELTAVSYWTQIVWAVPVLIVMLLLFDPPEFRMPAGMPVEGVQAALVAHMNRISQQPIQIAVNMTGEAIGCWIIAIQAVALRVVSKFSVLGAWTAGCLLAFVFVVVPKVAPTILQWALSS